MFSFDVTHTTGDHDWLVVSPNFTLMHHFKCAKVTADVRPPKLVIKRCATDRRFNHDVQRRGDSRRLPMVNGCFFPGFNLVRDIQIRDGKSGEPNFWL